MTAIHPTRLAVLIDAENARAANAPELMERISAFGRPTVCRAYGDWTTTQLMPWKKVLSSLVIKPCQQFRYARGKNSADCALIIDAMDLLHGHCIDGFCIVSSDSDYTALAARIQESGLLVYGFGNERTVPAFAAACTEFVLLQESGARSGAVQTGFSGTAGPSGTE